MKNKSFKVALFILFIFFSWTMHGAISAEERTALIALYNSTNGDSWTYNYGWKDGTLHTDGFALPGTENNWEGITIYDDHVTVIDLSSNNIKGNIPGQLGDLKYLRTLDLSNNGNSLKGSIPSALGNLGSIRKLRLNNNQLKNSIPSELGSLNSLQELKLNNNKLSGTIPTSLMNLTNLSFLSISNNCLNAVDEQLYEWLNNHEADWNSNQSSCNVAPSIIVTAPAADVTIPHHGGVTISWDGTDPDSDVLVGIFSDNDRNFENGGLEEIAWVQSKDGSYGWHGQSPNWGFYLGTYFICCTIEDESGQSYAYADGRVIVDEWIEVKTPNGGEIWIVGSSHQIEWEASDNLGPLSIFYVDGSDGSNTFIDSVSEDVRSYQWIVPNNVSTECKILVENNWDGGAEDQSDNSFSILTEPLKPSVTTNSLSSITSSGAIGGGDVTSDGGASVTARGVCWSTFTYPASAESTTTDGNGTGSFTSTITGLNPNTLYYVWAYATNSVGTTYGQYKRLTTLANATVPTVTTNDVSLVDSDSAFCGGNVASDGGAIVTACGVCWSKSSNPTTADFFTTDGSGTGSFTSSITGLDISTTYYVRAFATNSVGTAYGEERNFSTLSTATSPTVTTNAVSSITSNSAVCGGNVTSDGGAAVTARGVCWSTSTNPTTANSSASGGNGTGSFTANISGLDNNTTYYVRAFATNSIGTSYGTQRSFTTASQSSGHTLYIKSSPGTGIRISLSAKDKDGKGDGVTPFTRSYNTAANVTLTAPSYNNGKEFLHWLVDNKVQTGQSINLSMDRDHTAKAVYQASTYILTIQSSQDSVPITVVPNDNNGLGNGNTQFYRTYDGGTDVTLTAPAMYNGKNFLKWLVDGIEYTTREIQITMDDNHTAQAVYQSATYSLSIQSSPSGVDITVTPPDNNGDGDGSTNFNRTYNSGTSVILTAPTSFAGGSFINWEVNGKEFTDSTVQVTMEGNQTAVAYYETSTPPEIAVNRDSFNLGYIIGTDYQPTESITIYNSGGGTINWTASTGKDRITFSPASGTNYGNLKVTMSPVGLSPGKFSGPIYISDPLVSNSPVEVTVNLWVKAQKDWESPHGEFATPTDSAQVSGSLPVTGWVLGDTGVQRVEIFREDGNSLVYIGDAVFVEGVRTDIEAAYPDYPMHYKAGWGYMMLTNFLPNDGNGTFKIHAIASGNTGKKTTLGVRTIIVDNANAVNPFGTIDTPGQGGTISGSNYVNWGWVLTPSPNSIPTDGSTIDVFVDSVNLGHPTYNNYREDIATMFPGYANSNGAFGYLKINTTAYNNGSHQIWWIATDNAGNADGIGSRFFNILNTGTGQAQNIINLHPGTNDIRQTGRLIFPMNKYDGLSAIPFNNSEPITVRRGFKQNKIPQQLFPLHDGSTELIIHETEPFELHLEAIQEPALFSPSPGYFYGYMLVGEELRPLPVGSTLDTQKAIFYWIPGPGFFGDYDLLFVKKESNGEMWKKQIRLTIVPKFSR